MHAARILADSLSPVEVRLTTLEVTIPRIVLAELNTHRMFSRNSASSRAIPSQILLKRVMENPYIPSTWGKNQKGMQAGEEVSTDLGIRAEDEWLEARNSAVEHAEKLLGLGIHKQLTNRLLEPFMWHTVIVTATEWSNFFSLRCHPHAHPDIRIAAEKMKEAMQDHAPAQLDYGDYHLPLFGGIDDEPVGTTTNDALEAAKISVGRCARVSYLTHDGNRDPSKDIELHNTLLSNGHMSPLEHVARPIENADYQDWGIPLMVDIASKTHDPKHEETWCGNYRGWVQYRKTIPHESDLLRHLGD